MEDRTVYLDHAATTYVKPEVFEAMKPYFSEHFGNASSIYSLGRDSKKAVEESREKVAKAIGAEPKEVYFTGSGSEADNWALKGIAAAYKKKGNHIITSAIEHPAIMSSCKYLEGEGFEVTYVPVDSDGLVSPEQIRNAIKENTILISIMFANNEIGTIQPIKEIGAIAKEKGVLFHTDAVQAVGNINIDVKDLNVDLLSLSSHKFYGPKGIGALYIKKGVKIASFIHGGQQERGKRASTENVPGIIGLGRAIELATENLDEYNKKLIELREKTIEGLFAKVPYIRLNGHRHNRLPGNVNISFEFIEGESLLLMLDMKGVYGSSGSACSSGSLDPSHVLLAIGLPHEIAHGSLRLSFGDENTQEDVDYILEVIPQIVSRLRDMSPLWEAVKDKK
ncbi:cysteine desulfurase NifS [Ruminiclostridium papyrosolvens DSM 2782]|uniref:Cysteine desulfurase IscS n=1 Tax=Ruminiclostridium papyrosolvens DSM 2782 TaxID=588581 RepID=F1TAK4_9FIRM|nr:cysteine desulfurase NifS [Ruminiclostridium papyrosolvens]EGD48547.1 cysteine desulfurase NifS [Ruminiclostridium papyrosolvens DSM 2782]WES32697.1 cysteine desulfurase NifS [Ruminiclostridium papyrosolvens DSM 2782]